MSLPSLNLHSPAGRKATGGRGIVWRRASPGGFTDRLNALNDLLPDLPERLFEILRAVNFGDLAAAFVGFACRQEVYATNLLQAGGRIGGVRVILQRQRQHQTL